MADEQHNPAPQSPQHPGAGDASAAGALPPLAPPTVPGALGKPPRQAVWPNVIGVIGVIFAVGSILLTGWQAVAMLVFGSFSPGMPNAGPDFEAIARDWVVWIVVMSADTVAVALLLLVGCFGLLMRQPWSRKLLIIWAILRVATVVFNSIVGVLMGRDFMTEAAQQGQGIPLFFSDLFLWGSLIANLMIYNAFPVFMLIWLNLARAKREVATWGDESAT